MGNKAEITNLIGRKGSKMTMQSNVKTLALKVYDEQIPDGWDKLKERIKESKTDMRFLIPWDADTELKTINSY